MLLEIGLFKNNKKKEWKKKRKEIKIALSLGYSNSLLAFSRKINFFRENKIEINFFQEPMGSCFFEENELRLKLKIYKNLNTAEWRLRTVLSLIDDFEDYVYFGCIYELVYVVLHLLVFVSVNFEII